MKNIICINDEKYKSIYINFNILLDIKDYDVTSIAVITSMLSKATKKYQNQTEIKKYLMSLYGTNFEAGVKKIGDVYVIEFKVEFLNKLYTIDNEDLFDKVIVVTCHKETAIQRLMEYREFTYEEAVNRLNVQIDSDKQIERADTVIYNDGSLKELNTEVRNWIKENR